MRAVTSVDGKASLGCGRVKTARITSIMTGFRLLLSTSSSLSCGETGNVSQTVLYSNRMSALV
jgi:hypothetical protein